MTRNAAWGFSPTINQSNSKINNINIDSIQNGRVALNLSDLVTDNNIGLDNNNNNNKGGYKDNGTLDYEKELIKLLQKSRGTKYENTLQDIVATKIRQSREKADAEYNKENNKRNENYQRLDISRLDESKKESQKVALSLSSYPDRSSRLSELSKPFAHHAWKGPSSSPLKSNKGGAFIEASVIFSASRSKSPSCDQQSLASNKQSVKFSPNKSVNINIASSPKKFKDWYKDNKEWKKNSQKNIKKKKEEFTKSIENEAKPRLIASKSISLAEIANMKYVSKALKEEIKNEKINEVVLHTSCLSPQKNRLTTSESPIRLIKGSGIGGGIVGSYIVSSVNKSSKGARSPSPSGFGSSSIRKVTPVFNNNNNNNDLNKNNYDSPIMKSRSMSPIRVLDKSASNAIPLEINNNVFDRLQLRGRVESNNMRSWTPPPKTDSFSPRLDSNSLKMAEKGGRISIIERARSASADNRSPKKYLRKSGDNSGNIVNINNNEDSRGRSRNITPVRNQLDNRQSLSPNNSILESNMKSSRPFVLGSRIDISSLNKISDTKNENTNSASKKKIQPFTPILSAVETLKIMAIKEKTGETFEDRVNKSVENFYVQNAVKTLTSRSSPGPGYYSATNPDLISSYNVSTRSSSPAGTRGYSFNKEIKYTSPIRKDKNKIKK